MKALSIIILLMLSATQPVLAKDNRLDNTKAAFQSLLDNTTLPLTKASGCKQFLNRKGDQTIGQLMASFLAWPAEQPKHQYFIHSDCIARKREVNNSLVATHQCTLTVTEEADNDNNEKVHIIATLVFAVTQKERHLIKDSLICL